MKISDYAKAQGWLKRHASSENSTGEWEKYVALNTTPELDEAIKTIDDKFGPGTVFPASEAPIPPMTDQQAIMEFNERNPYSDGQLVTPSVDGSRPGYGGSKPLYQNVEGQPHIKRHPVSKKYLVTRSVMRDGKTTSQYKGGIDDLDEAIKIRDQFVTDLPPETPAETNIRTKKGKGKLDTKELQKASKFFYKRGEISSPNYLDLKEEELKKVYDNVRKGATPGKFSKTTVFDPIKKSAQNKILKQFPEADFELYKFGFNSKADQQKFDAVKEFIKRGYKPAFHNITNLPKNTQNLIIEAFGREAFESGIDLKFGPGRKFGITPKEDQQVYTMIKNFVENTGKEYPYAFSFEKPQNWIIAQMHRASKNNPNVYKVFRNDAGKIIGASENGVKYYHANSKIGNTITNHPEAEKISKFVSVAKNAKASIPQSLIKMFPEGFDTNLLKGNRAYTDLLQWLDNSKGRRITANAINVHHGGAGGVTGNPALAKDLQLLTRQDNITAEVIKNQILDNDFSRVQELKDKGIRLNVGGKEYGAGFETAEQGLKRIETQAGTKLTERLKTDPKLTNFKKFLKQDITKKNIKNIFGPEWCGQADGGRIGFNKGSGCPIDVKIKNFQEANERVRLGEGTMDDAAKIRKTNIKGVKAAGSLKALLGIWGLGGEVLIEGAFAANEMMKGKSGREAWSESYASYLDPTMYKGGIKLSGQDVAMRELDLNTGEQLALELDNQSKQLMKLIETQEFSDIEGAGDISTNYSNQIAALKQEMEATKSQLSQHGGMEANTQSIQVKLDDYRDKQGTTAFTKPYRTNLVTYDQDGNKIQRSRAGKNTITNREIIGRELFDQDAIPQTLVPDKRFNIDQKKKILGIMRKDPNINEAFWKIQMGQDSPLKGNIYGASDTFFGETYSNGGIAGVKKVDPDELKEAQEKMKKLMKQYKNKNLDWDAVKRSYKIWTK